MKSTRKEHSLANSEFGQALRQEIGNNIKALRTERNISPAQLAEKAGISTPQIYNIEAGSCFASAPVLFVLAGLLDMRRSVPFVSNQFSKKWRKGL
jgi:transcriptional regulator with XRE-family HTH domain